MKSDLITGIIAAAFSVFYLSQTTTIKIFGGATGGVNARTVPEIWGSCLLILSIILIVRSIYGMAKAKKNPTLPEQGNFIKNLIDKREVVYTFALLIGYAALMKPVGFIITSIIYVFLQILILTPIKKRSRKVMGIAAVMAVTFSTVLYYVFTKYFVNILFLISLLFDFINF